MMLQVHLEPLRSWLAACRLRFRSRQRWEPWRERPLAELAIAVRDTRELRGITALALANLAGIPNRSIHAIEQGRGSTPARVLLVLEELRLVRRSESQRAA